ncbi:phage/plasmid primase, P4 family [Lysinibacillus sp. ACHW1.5]|nr:phage/plasmid primase, P4 family [Lysinibacillus sp. ACHW1.5]UKJ47719.1 phage/plasmid primase, P4 family [Lysinibacillus sp. ACHW1.5]
MQVFTLPIPLMLNLKRKKAWTELYLMNFFSKLQMVILIKRLQELFGYVISGYRELKYLPFLLGVKDSGKSIILKLLEYLVGIENTTNLSFEQLNKSEYLVELFNKRLNTCGETSEVSLNKLDVFKKITGGDFIMARQLYNQPIKFVNTAVLVFAGNHLPIIKGQDSYSAFSKRLLIFPFDYSVPKESQDIQLYDKLIDEIDYIASWAIKGLKRLIKNNFEFTTNEYIEAILDNFINNNNSISNFINRCCEINVTKQTHTYELYKAYESFCNINNYTLESNNQFCAFLNNLSGLQKTRFRKNDENKLGYKGIKLIEGEN